MCVRASCSLVPAATAVDEGAVAAAACVEGNDVNHGKVIIPVEYLGDRERDRLPSKPSLIPFISLYVRSVERWRVQTHSTEWADQK